MRAALQRAWRQRGGLALLLLPLSLLYIAITAVRSAAYAVGLRARYRAPVPVVVVGNVVAGGAGKTPVVIAIAQHLARRGLRVGVVSRGHGRTSRGCQAVDPHGDPAASGDEPLLIARRTAVPVFVAERRPEAVQALLKDHPEVQVILADDGLQHLALARDLEVCVFDDRGVGNGWRLPAGPLREAWPRRVDFVLRTPGAGHIEGHDVSRRLAAVAIDASGQPTALANLAHQPCDALAGIAQPEAFFDSLRAAGVPLRRTFALPDHFDFAEPGPWLPRDGTRLLCTEKDAAKLWRHAPGALAVPLEVDIDGEFWRGVDAALDAKLSSTHGPQAA